MRILTVDDDPQIAKLTRMLLEEGGYAVDTAESCDVARTLAMVNEYDGVVLDLDLPDGSGITVVQDLRRNGRDTPILVLTGHAESQMTVRALDAGADDYLTKPFLPDVFKARVRALVRRGGATRTEKLAAGNVVLDRLTRTVLVSGTPLRVTPRELAMLEYLLLHTGEVVTRSQMLEKVFDLAHDPGTNVVDVNVARLRKKLEAAGASVKIEARRGMGLVLNG
jgi:two-component system, OmpR family, response regulator